MTISRPRSIASGTTSSPRSRAICAAGSINSSQDGKQWRPERFEFAFGLPGDLGRDPRSVPDAARVDGRYLIRGSIDLIERRLDGKALRVTDHKTGRNRTNLATMVDGGRVLQPVLYGMALEAITGEGVEEGRRTARRWVRSASTPFR